MDTTYMAEHAVLISDCLDFHLVETTHNKVIWEEVCCSMDTQSEKYVSNFMRWYITRWTINHRIQHITFYMLHFMPRKIFARKMLTYLEFWKIIFLSSQWDTKRFFARASWVLMPFREQLIYQRLYESQVNCSDNW